jgi:hypothetical protein
LGQERWRYLAIQFIIVPLRRFVGFVHKLEEKRRFRSLNTLQYVVENFASNDQIAIFARSSEQPVEERKENQED